MMFIEELMKVGESYSSYSLYGSRMFNHIFIGNVELSIQASFCHHCSSRKTLKDINMYDTFEVALIGENKLVIDTLKDYADFNAFNSEAVCNAGIFIFSNVPKELIEKVYLKLKEKENYE